MENKRTNTENPENLPDPKRFAFDELANYLGNPQNNAKTIPSFLVPRDLHHSHLLNHLGALETAYTDVEETNEEISNGAKELEGCSAKFRRLVKELNELVMTYKNEVKLAFTDFSEIKVFFAGLKDAYHNMDQDISEIEENLKNIPEQDEKEKQNLQALYDQTQGLYDSVIALGKENGKLQTENAELEEKLHELEDKETKILASIKVQEEEQLKQIEASQAAEKEIAELDNKIAEIAVENQNAEALLAEMLAEMELTTEEHDELCQKRITLDAERIKIEKRIQVQQRHVQQMQNCFDENAAEVDELEKNIETLEAENDKLNQEIENEKKLRLETEIQIMQLKAERNSKVQDVVNVDEFSPNSSTSDKIVIPTAAMESSKDTSSKISPFVPAANSTVKTNKVAQASIEAATKKGMRKKDKAQERPILVVKANKRRSNTQLPTRLDSSSEYVPIHRRPRTFLA